MKVAVLAHSFPRFPGDTHGPFVKALSEALTRRGHEVFALIPWDPEIGEDPQTPLTIRSFRYVWPDRWHLLGYSRTLKADVGMRLGAYALSPLYFLFAARALRRLVEAEGIEMVHAHWLLPNGWVANRVHRATGVPFAVTLHGSDVFMAERTGLFRAMARQTVAGASHITSCSADLQERLGAIVGGGAAAEKILLLPNGTDLETDRPVRADAVRERHGVGATDRVLVAVGRMVHKKGFPYLLDAMPEVLRKQPRAKLLLGGDGDIRGELEARARELGLGDRVVFTGGLQHDEVIDLIHAGEVFVMPSIRDSQGNIDGLPIVVLEAMAAAKPVLATDVAGMPLAVLDGVTGRLVAEKDSGALATSIIDLLAAPEEATAMGCAGRERIVNELNWDAIAGRHHELYEAAR